MLNQTQSRHAKNARRATFPSRILGFQRAPLVSSRGYDVRYLDAGIEPFDAGKLLAPDLVVVLGGPIGVYERNAYPFISDEIAAIAARIEFEQADPRHLPGERYTIPGAARGWRRAQSRRSAGRH